MLNRWIVVAAVLAVGSVVIALVTVTGQPARTRPGPPTASTTRAAGGTSAVAPTPGPTSCAEATLAGMSPRTRIGQLFLLGIPADGAGQGGPTISASAPGGVFLTGRGTGGTSVTAALLAAVQARGRAASGGAGMFTAVDQEGGQVQVLGGPGFSRMPPADVQGTWAPAELQAAAATWGRQLHAAGVNVDLAPVADVLSPTLGTANVPIGRYGRAFGTDPETVASHAVAFARGMQDAGIQSVVKHFPGLGRVRGNTDVSAGVTDSVTTTTDPDLEPFARTTRATPSWVMVSTAIYTRIAPRTAAAFSPAVIGLLRAQIGYSGLVLSDDLGNAAQVAAVPAGRRAVEFLTAGGDVVLTAAPSTLASMVNAVLAATADPGVAALATTAELRVLTAKQEMGLLPCAPVAAG